MTFKYKASLAALLASIILPASADIYAFVDETGVAHYSNEQLDDRYTLFKRENAPTLSDSEPLSVQQKVTPKTNFVPNAPGVEKRRKQFAKIVQKVAKETKISPSLLDAIITAESGYQPNAVSPRGALGMMQLMPVTAARYGVTDPLNAEQNIRGGAKYMRDLLKMFNQNLELAVAAYNAGEGSVIRAGYAVPKFKETQNYVPKVIGNMNRTQFTSMKDKLGQRLKVTLLPIGMQLVDKVKQF
ncbi:lytic transglycosylase domain-containing protein [Leeia sp. TBRC 13508]|uniref:Lytic transglycosylase domain-containing protein n=1 Tax=Leeia speluncae TaxID=2884804 RepID=A0ABS8DAH5_9NEIS|nr:lytic transglycosylase domain-containing protein [Leeia speluncae]MCB6185205.1 lytic transglycosylase domain-containing protein [Leeia speluncae]